MDVDVRKLRLAAVHKKMAWIEPSNGTLGAAGGLKGMVRLNRQPTEFR